MLNHNFLRINPVLNKEIPDVDVPSVFPTQPFPILLQQDRAHVVLVELRFLYVIPLCLQEVPRPQQLGGCLQCSPLVLLLDRM